MSRPSWFVVPALVAALLACVCPAMAVPAAPFPAPFLQPDGTKVVVHQRGDEWFNYLVTDTGYVVVRGHDGYLRYAVLDGSATAVSSARVGIDAVPPASVGPRETARWHELKSAETAVAAAATRRIGTAIAQRAAKVPGTERLLVLLVSFTDVSIRYSDADWATYYFGTTGKTVRTYYDAVSNGAFRFTPAEETSGTANDGIVSVSLPYAHPNTGSTWGPANQKIVADALTAADGVVNFAAFDTDHSGGLSTDELHVVTVIAGYDASFYNSLTPSVWAHRWSLPNDTLPAPILDGVAVADYYSRGGYVQIGEVHASAKYAARQAPIGVSCHELGHDLGLPDLYDTTNVSAGVGVHCLMGYGSWGTAQGDPKYGATPVMMSAWCRQRLGFALPTVIGADGFYTATEVSSPAQAVFYRVPGPTSLEYFLVETRNMTGWDAGLYYDFAPNTSGAGLAVWHVDETMNSNRDRFHRLVDIEEPLETPGSTRMDLWTDEGQLANYFYAGNGPGIFDDTSVPSSTLYTGARSGITLDSIPAGGPSMTFRVAFAADPSAPAEATALGFAAGSRNHLVWTSSAPAFDLYRGALPRASTTDYGACVNTGGPLTAAEFIDGSPAPAAGTAVFFLVRPRTLSPVSFGSLGTTSSGQERTNTNPVLCPP